MDGLFIQTGEGVHMPSTVFFRDKTVVKTALRKGGPTVWVPMRGHLVLVL